MITNIITIIILTVFCIVGIAIGIMGCSNRDRY